MRTSDLSISNKPYNYLSKLLMAFFLFTISINFSFSQTEAKISLAENQTFFTEGNDLLVAIDKVDLRSDNFELFISESSSGKLYSSKMYTSKDDKLVFKFDRANIHIKADNVLKLSVGINTYNDNEVYFFPEVKKSTLDIQISEKR